MISVLPIALPLGIAAGVAAGWSSWRRFADPPRFSAYSVRLRWMVDPMAWVDRDLRNGELSSAIHAVIARVREDIRRSSTARAGQSRIRFWGPRRSPDPLFRQRRRLARRLENAWHLALLGEDRRLTDPWSRWRQRRWNAKARNIFEKALSEARSERT